MPGLSSLAQAVIWFMFAASLAAWAWWLMNAMTGRTVINRRVTAPVPWPPIAAFSGTVIGFAAPVLLLTFVVIGSDYLAGNSGPADKTENKAAAATSEPSATATASNDARTSSQKTATSSPHQATPHQATPHRKLTRQDIVLGVALKILQLATVLAVVWICSPAGSIKLPHLGLPMSERGYDLYCGAFGLVFAMLPVYAVNLSLLEYRKTAPDGTGFHQLLGATQDNPQWDFVALVAFSAIIVAPIVEEVLYRVILQPSLIHGLGHRMGLIATAALFAGAHYQPNNPDPLALFPLALVLGWVYDRRQSLPAVLLLHGLFNGLNLALLLLTRD